ncbi:hypothetical protein [Streptomyces sp. A 4/2]|uniref:hypothetical protein n=1 Tax=Streptomyces sp. A 4/2 TaxID=2934314 RepID=UPI002024D54A|nr:hypothetical protein [Streptomyces sp. A 4/2]
MTSTPGPISDPTYNSPLLVRFPALGFVPCPGDAPEAKHITAIVTRTAKALDGISNVLHGTGDGDWQGKHAEAFREQFDDNFRPKIDTAKKSFRKAAAALRDWSESMPEWQSKAAGLESRAQDARDKHEVMRHRLAELPPKHASFDLPKDDAEALKRERVETDRSSAELASSTAEAELEVIRAQARKLASDYILEGQSVARRLDKAMDIAPNEPGALHKLGDAIKSISKALEQLDDLVLNAIDGVVAEAVQWIKEHANAIAGLGDMLGFVSTVLAVVGIGLHIAGIFFPPLEVAAGGVDIASGVTALGALGLHVTAKLAGADVSTRALVDDGLGALSLFASPNVAAAAKAPRMVTAFTRFGERAGGASVIDGTLGAFQDHSILDNFKIHNSRQALEAGTGNILLVGFENVWNSGSGEDRAVAKDGK